MKTLARRVFANRFRYFILLLGLLCTAMISANMNAFNFTVICMNKTNRETNATTAYFSQTEKSTLLWVPAISTLISAIPFSSAYAKYGAHTVLGVASLASALLMAVFPLSVQFGMYAMLFVRFLQGITYAADFAAMGVLCSSWAPLTQLGVFVSTLSLYPPISTIVVNTSAGLLCTSPFGWPMVYYSFSAITLAAGIAWLYFYTIPDESMFVSKRELEKIHVGKSEAQISNENKRVPYKEILQSPVVWVIWFNALAELCAGSFILMYKPSFFRYALKFDIRQVGFLISLPTILHIPLKIGFGYASDRIRNVSERMKLCIWNTVGVGFPAFAYVGIAYAPSPMFAVFCFVLVGIFFATNGGGFFKCATLCSRKYSHFVIGNVQLCKCLAQFISPALVAIFVHDETNYSEWRTIFIVFAVLTFTANILFCCIATEKPLKFTETVRQRPDSTAFENSK